jgi:hypothetical protein
MTLTQYLQSQGLKQKVIDDFLPYVAPHGESGFFWDAAGIMAPCEFYCKSPRQVDIFKLEFSVATVMVG